MLKAYWEKESYETEDNELMAQTLSKIKPFEWVRIEMYSLDNIFHDFPTFFWRFYNTEEKIYKELEKCIGVFRGNLEWIMYKGFASDKTKGRNYTIEPKFVYELKKDRIYSEDISIKDKYLQKQIAAIQDIRPLCEHIEKWFGLQDKKSNLPVIPKRNR